MVPAVQPVCAPATNFGSPLGGPIGVSPKVPVAQPACVPAIHVCTPLLTHRGPTWSSTEYPSGAARMRPRHGSPITHRSCHCHTTRNTQRMQRAEHRKHLNAPGGTVTDSQISGCDPGLRPPFADAWVLSRPAPPPYICVYILQIYMSSVAKWLADLSGSIAVLDVQRRLTKHSCFPTTHFGTPLTSFVVP